MVSGQSILLPSAPEDPSVLQQLNINGSGSGHHQHLHLQHQHQSGTLPYCVLSWVLKALQKY